MIAVNYNGTYYYYLRNAQNDVVKLIDGSGNAVIQYTYDSWGKLLSTSGSLAETFGAEQPFRYRGYVYDEETGFYYLQSRYYNPEVGRFISADIYLSTGQGVLGHNAYAYCRNNPIVRHDSSGLSDEDESDIYNLIKSNTTKARRLNNLLCLGSIMGGLLNGRSVSNMLLCAEGAKYVVFYLNVKAGGPMDYKNEECWKSALPRLAFPGENGENKEYMLNGNRISASDLGNINYGAVGAALNIPLNVLLWQAGAAQLRDHEGFGLIRSQVKSIIKGSVNYYGDERDDYEYISMGYNLYLDGYFGG